MHPPERLQFTRAEQLNLRKLKAARVCSCMATDANGRLEVVTVRFTKRVRDLIKQVAEARGSDESAVIWQAVHLELARLSFLTDDEKKALGVTA
jgi:hypothetical protein